MPCLDGITDPIDYCTVSTFSAGAFIVLILLCCLLVVLPACICVRKRKRKRRGKMEVGTTYKMQVENAIPSHNICLEDITRQPATPEQDSNTFKSTAAVKQPLSTSLQTSEQDPKVLGSNIDQPVSSQPLQHCSSTTSPFKVSADEQPRSCSIETTPTTVAEQPPISLQAPQRSCMDWPEVNPMTIV